MMMNRKLNNLLSRTAFAVFSSPLWALKQVPKAVFSQGNDLDARDESHSFTTRW